MHPLGLPSQSASADPDTREQRSHVWVVNAAASGRWPSLEIGQFWAHRELIFFFAVRDLKVQYKQAFLGVAWAVIQPLIGALAFTILFNHLAHANVEGRSYFAFALLGFGVWTYFSAAIAAGTSSLVFNAELLTKVAFPRIVAPAAALLPGFVDLAVAVVLATAIGLATGGGLSALNVAIGLPLGLALLVASVTGPVLYMSAIVVRYRDAKALVSFGLQFLLFASPVAYPPDFVPPAWRTILYLNPLAGAVGLLRGAFVNTDLPPTRSIALSVAVATVMLLVGLVHFRRHEREFADII